MGWDAAKAVEHLDRTYSTDLPDTTRTNTVAGVVQNTPGRTTDFTGTALVGFAGATVTTPT